MHKFAAYFSVMFILLSLAMLFTVLYFNMPQLLAGDKIVLFAFLNSAALLFVGIFFFIFKNKIILYFENYKREKQI